MKTKLYGIMDVAISEIQARHEELDRQFKDLEAEKQALKDKEAGLCIKNTKLQEREDVVGNREMAVGSIMDVAAQRKSRIEALLENQKELVNARLKAEREMKDERVKRQTAEKALQTCLSDKAELERDLSIAQMETRLPEVPCLS